MATALDKFEKERQEEIFKRSNRAEESKYVSDQRTKDRISSQSSAAQAFDQKIAGIRNPARPELPDYSGNQRAGAFNYIAPKENIQGALEGTGQSSLERDARASAGSVDDINRRVGDMRLLGGVAGKQDALNAPMPNSEGGIQEYMNELGRPTGIFTGSSQADMRKRMGDKNAAIVRSEEGRGVAYVPQAMRERTESAMTEGREEVPITNEYMQRAVARASQFGGPIGSDFSEEFASGREEKQQLDENTTRALSNVGVSEKKYNKMLADAERDPSRERGTAKKNVILDAQKKIEEIGRLKEKYTMQRTKREEAKFDRQVAKDKVASETEVQKLKNVVSMAGFENEAQIQKDLNSVSMSIAELDNASKRYVADADLQAEIMKDASKTAKEREVAYKKYQASLSVAKSLDNKSIEKFKSFPTAMANRMEAGDERRFDYAIKLNNKNYMMAFVKHFASVWGGTTADGQEKVVEDFFAKHEATAFDDIA